MYYVLQFQSNNFPSPLHILTGILRAKNVSFSLKIRLLSDMAALQRYARGKRADLAVAQWLRQRNVPRRLVAEFWQPLVWGALNTPLEHASLRVLCNVLSDGVWADKSGSDYLLPKRDLGAIIAEPALAKLKQYGADIRLETRVGRLKNLPDGRVVVNDEVFDAVIVAVAPYHAVHLFPEDTPDYIQTTYQNLRYHSITTVYLRYAVPVHLPAPLTGFADGTAQWLVYRGALGLPANEVAAVISVSDHVGAFKSQEWAEKVHADVKRICPYLDEPEAVRVITEKRATTACTPDSATPDFAWLHQRRIYPAGDYLHPRYPATLEAAVQSGLTAAEMCLADFGLI